MKLIKKIAPLAISALMMALPFTGALNIADWKGTFTEANTAVVVGSTVGVDDMAAALVVAQAVGIDTTVPSSTSISGESWLLKSSGDNLNYGQTLDTVKDRITKTQLPTLLADGTLRDDSSGDESDYTQDLVLGADAVTFGALDSENYVVNTDAAATEKPILYIDESTGEIWTYTVEFSESVDAGLLDDAETVTLLGKTFTFDPDMASADTDLVMFAGSESVTVNVNDAAGKTVSSGGKSFVIKVIGGNPENSEATIDINGVLKQVEAGETVMVDGQRFYVQDIFQQTIPTPGVSVMLMVGADKVTIDASLGAGVYGTVQLNDEDLDGVTAAVDGTGDVSAIDEINFQFTPSNMDAETDQAQFLEIGESISDPLFGTLFETFKDVVPALKADDKDKIMIARSGDHLKVDFTNKDGDVCSFKPYQGDGTDITLGDDIFAAVAGTMGGTTAGAIPDNGIFILNEGGNADLTHIYQLKDTDLGEDTATFKDLCTDDTITVKAGDELGDSGAYVCAADGSTNIAGTTIVLEDAVDCAGVGVVSTENTVITENEMTVEFWPVTAAIVGANDEAAISFLEEADNIEDGDVTEAWFGVLVSSDADNDVRVTTLTASEQAGGITEFIDLNGGGTASAGEPQSLALVTDAGDSLTTATDDDNNVDYGLTDFGTYMELEAENHGEYFNLWIPAEENVYEVYLSQGATTSGGGGSWTAVSDTDTAAFSGKNIIALGGTAVNKVARRFLGMDENTQVFGSDAAWQTATGVDAIGKGVLWIKPSPYNSQKYAMLIAGYEKADTEKTANYLTVSGTGLAKEKALFNTAGATAVEITA